MQLGKPVDIGTDEGRDAIHVAVISATTHSTQTEERIKPGQKVWACYMEWPSVVVKTDGDEDDYLGIIDPFIDEDALNDGNYFLVVLKPGTVQNLSHTWDHEDLDTAEVPFEMGYDNGCRGC